MTIFYCVDCLSTIDDKVNLAVSYNLRSLVFHVIPTYYKKKARKKLFWDREQESIRKKSFFKVIF